MSKKMSAIRLAKLEKVVTALQPTLESTIARSIGELKGGRCVSLNGLGTVELKKLGFDARLVGGKAAFSFNKGKRGIIDYGYQPNPFHPYAEEGIQSFEGHAWIEIRRLGVIVDFTLPALKGTMLADNLRNGINDTEFRLSSKAIVPMNDITTFNELYDNFKIGYHYKRSKDTTDYVEYLADLFLEMHDLGRIL